MNARHSARFKFKGLRANSAKHFLLDRSVAGWGTFELVVPPGTPSGCFRYASSLARDRQSGEYFVERGQWAPVIEDALDFRDTRSAVRAAPKTGRAELEIVLSFDDPSSNAAIPVDK